MAPRLVYSGCTIRAMKPDVRYCMTSDDFGMCHAGNAAITRSLTAGVVTSTTLVGPCAWALRAMQRLAAHRRGTGRR